MRAVAIDWSGKEKGATEFIWIAEARDGELVDLRNGLGREAVIERVMALARLDDKLVVGLDFAFSFPEWWCESNGWSDAREVWHAMAEHGETLLRACEAPLWGRPGKRNPNRVDRAFRTTDAGGAKSVFQIGGAGAVGTGSIRGMRHLLDLSMGGFSVWPFDPPGLPRVIEIYPRALTGPVNKSRWQERHEYLLRRFAGQKAALLERAAGSADAFDAAVSAIVMSEHAAELAALDQVVERPFAIEGCIWRPG